MDHAVLFDIDGTLVDSNYLHIDTWARALGEVGQPTDAWRIHRCIGMDSAKLLETLLGDEADAAGERAKDRHSELYLEQADRLRPFAGARDLVAELARRGTRVVLATSAPDEELELLRKVLKVDEHLADYTSSGDVETAKPSPDLIEVALQKAGVDAAHAVMVGDTVWDVEAAKRAGVACIGVLSGGIAAEELYDAGAVAVYTDVAELLAGIETSPLPH
jgi:HAD superfamily hydrolase (TIGR01509 family)